jgi:hypothetical protein
VNDLLETLAKAIHRDYVRRREEDGVEPNDASLAPWEDLPETLKESNRSQAADIHRKLAAAGYQVVRAPQGDVPETNFEDEEIELLAELEHERWVDERLASGWRLDATRDVHTKRSPYLIPWAELTEDIRDLDRDSVRRIQVFLAQAGFAVLRVP